MTSAENGSVPDRLVDKAGKLYTLPSVAVEVLQLTDQPDVDVERLRHSIENDPALTTRVLRVVNSSLFGLSNEVSDLKQALALLGTKPLKLLVLGFSLPDNLFVGMAGDILRRYWRRTLTKAVAAREISETLWKLPGDEAFLAGLLQDVGILVLLQEYGEPYVRLLDAAFAKARDVGSLAAQAIGFDHAHLSARLLERWGLPKNLVEAIGAGRPPAKIAELPPPARCLPQVLHLAELLAGLLTENRTDLLPDLLDAAERYHALRRSELSGLVGTLQAKVEQLADVLNLDLGAGTDYTAVLLEAHCPAVGRGGRRGRRYDSSRSGCRRGARKRGAARGSSSLAGRGAPGRPLGDATEWSRRRKRCDSAIAIMGRGSRGASANTDPSTDDSQRRSGCAASPNGPAGRRA